MCMASALKLGSSREVSLSVCHPKYFYVFILYISIHLFKTLSVFDF